MLDGLHKNLSIEEYHSGPGVSRSSLMLMLESPFHYKNKDQIVFKDSDAKTIGSMVHGLILEPHLFDIEFALQPDVNRRTKAGKIELEEFKEANAGKIIYSQDMLNLSKSMVDSFFSFDDHKKLFENICAEESIFWTDKETGIQLKCRPDAWIKSGNIIVDLKTTKSAKPRQMQRSCLDYGYYLQAAMIKEGLDSLGCDMTQFIVAAIEKAAPFASSIFFIDKDALNFGANQLRVALRDLAKCLETDKWPSYAPGLLSIPDYLKDRF